MSDGVCGKEVFERSCMWRDGGGKVAGIFCPLVKEKCF